MRDQPVAAAASRLVDREPGTLCIDRGVTAMRGQDVVCASLAGAMAAPARALIDAIHAEGVTRLLFVSSMAGDPVGARRRPKGGQSSWLAPLVDGGLATACLGTGFG